MSRGPEGKGAPERDKKMKNRKQKEKEEKKRKNETFQIHGRGPHPIYPHEFK